jgi:hypothetical protein
MTNSFNIVNEYKGILKDNFEILINPLLKDKKAKKITFKELQTFIESNITIPSSGIEEAPIDGNLYGRQNGLWTLVSFGAESDPIFLASDAASITNTDITNWNTAFGWGDHSLAGYLTSFTESDPIYSASSWFSTTNNSTNWNTAFSWGNHASAGYLTSISGLNISLLTNDSGYITSSALSSYAPLASPTFTGTPAAPTASVDTNTTQIATTAFVVAQITDQATPYVFGTHAVNGTVGAGATLYWTNRITGAGAGTLAQRQSTMSFAGTGNHLQVRTSTTQPVSGSLVITVQKNGVDTALVLTIAAGSIAGVYENTVNSFTFVDNDLISFKVVNGASGSSAGLYDIQFNCIKS